MWKRRDRFVETTANEMRGCGKETKLHEQQSQRRAQREREGERDRERKTSPLLVLCLLLRSLQVSESVTEKEKLSAERF